MKILVVDDNAIVRMGLRIILERLETVESVQEACDGVEALEQVREFSPDVVLLDVHMPRKGGLEVLPEIASQARVLMLTSDNATETIQAALQAGAKGFLVHGHLSTEDVSSALTICASGGMALGPEASRVLSSGSVAEKPEEPHPFSQILTEREMLVLESAAKGFSNQEIAQAEFLSPRTVKNYLNSSYVKLGVHNRGEAVAAWHQALDSE